MNRIAYFRVWINDWLSSPKRALWGLPERGLYTECWLVEAAFGPLPDDAAKIARLTCLPLEQVALVWPTVRTAFEPGPEPGTLVHPKVEFEVAQAIRQREEQRRKARIGVAKRSAAAKPAAPAAAEPVAAAAAPAAGPALSFAPSLQRSAAPSDQSFRAPSATRGRRAPSGWAQEACQDWIDRFEGTAPGGPIGRALKPLVDRHTWGHVRPAWQKYLGATDAQFASAARFASTYGQWNGTAAPAAGPASKDSRTVAAIQRVVDRHAQLGASA